MCLLACIYSDCMHGSMDYACAVFAWFAMLRRSGLQCLQCLQFACMLRALSRIFSLGEKIGSVGW